MIPKNASVRLLNAQLEELEYGKLYEAYSSKGRKSAADPRVLFKVLVYGYLCGIYSSRKLEEACQYRIDFRWLLEDRKAPDHCTFARFRTGRCRDALEDLFYQLVQRLEDIGETDHTAVFIDGTKLESCAGRYTFVWRKSVEKQLTKVKEEIRRETGLTSPLDLQAYLDDLAAGISFVHGSGKRKSGEQRVWEKLHTLLERWQKYEGQLSTMGEGRNSYSKTDEDATFMRMKEDHMRNGQLKPGYNVQLAVNSEYITGIEAFSDRSDVKTLKPFLQRLEEFHHTRYKEVVADAGYESLENYLYLDSTDQVCFIKPTNYDQKKSKSFRSRLAAWRTWHTTRKKIALPAHREGSCRYSGNARRKKTDSLCPPLGIGVKAAPAVPAEASAAAPKIRNSRKSFACRKPSGRSVRGPSGA